MNQFTRLRQWAEKKMMYSAETDSAGVQHYVCIQRKNMSCGIACVAMVVHRVRGIQLLESTLRSYSNCFYQGPNTDSKGYDAKNGTEIFNLAIMLKKMCVPSELKNGGRTRNVLAAATPQTPVIALVHWPAEGAGGGGGHFVVVDNFNADTGMAIICDPWYGLVECKVDNGRYTVNNAVSGDFSGKWVIPA
jgi:hypothetical protein